MQTSRWPVIALILVIGVTSIGIAICTHLTRPPESFLQLEMSFENDELKMRPSEPPQYTPLSFGDKPQRPAPARLKNMTMGVKDADAEGVEYKFFELRGKRNEKVTILLSKGTDDQDRSMKIHTNTCFTFIPEDFVIKSIEKNGAAFNFEETLCEGEYKLVVRKTASDSTGEIQTP